MPGHSDDTKREVWRKRLQRFARSSHSVARFCTHEGVSVASFYNWRNKVNSNGDPRRAYGQRRANGRHPAFQPVMIGPTPGVPTYVEIHLPCGATIEVRSEDLETVRTVVVEVARGLRRDPQRDGVSC